MPSEPRLRVAFLLDARVTPAWIAFVLGRLAEEPGVELTTVGISGLGGRLEGERARRLLRLYMWVDRHVFRSRNDASARTNISPLVEGKLEVDPAAIDWATTEVDVAVDLRVRAGPVRPGPRLGVLAVEHAGSGGGADDLPLVAQFFARERVARTTVYLVSDGEDRRPLRRSTYRIDDHSLYRTQNYACWRASHLLLRALRDLHRDQHAPGQTAASSGRKGPERRRSPSTAAIARHLALLGPRLLASRIRNLLFREEWFIGFGEVDPVSPAPALRGFAVLEPPPRRGYADPFVLEHGGRRHVFVEDIDARTGHGVISTFEVPRAGDDVDAEVVLQRPYHLSYPFVLSVGGVPYMIPESAQNRTVDLFRAVRFPQSWALSQTLLHDVAAVDATIVEHEGLFWLFANVLEHGTQYGDELSVFHAPSLFDEWTPHPMNPVVSDVTRARPAGRLFRHEGSLIRPGQDSSRRYGGSVVLNRVDVLTEREYRETPIARLGPDWRRDNRGTHTYNREGTLAVVDGRRWVTRIASRRGRLVRRRH
jgi:hypothetical protein